MNGPGSPHAFVMAGRLSRNREAMAAPLRLWLDRQKQRTMCWLTGCSFGGVIADARVFHKYDPAHPAGKFEPFRVSDPFVSRYAVVL